MSYIPLSEQKKALEQLQSLHLKVERMEKALKIIQKWDCLNPPEPNSDFLWLKKLVDEALKDLEGEIKEKEMKFNGFIISIKCDGCSDLEITQTDYGIIYGCKEEFFFKKCDTSRPVNCVEYYKLKFNRS